MSCSQWPTSRRVYHTGLRNVGWRDIGIVVLATAVHLVKTAVLPYSMDVVTAIPALLTPVLAGSANHVLVCTRRITWTLKKKVS